MGLDILRSKVLDATNSWRLVLLVLLLHPFASSAVYVKFPKPSLLPFFDECFELDSLITHISIETSSHRRVWLPMRYAFIIVCGYAH